MDQKTSLKTLKPFMAIQYYETPYELFFFGVFLYGLLDASSFLLITLMGIPNWKKRCDHASTTTSIIMIDSEWKKQSQ